MRAFAVHVFVFVVIPLACIFVPVIIIGLIGETDES